MLRTNVSFRLSISEHEILEALSFRTGFSRSKILRDWIKPFLEEAAEDPVIREIIALRRPPPETEELKELKDLTEWVESDRLTESSI